MLSDDNISLFPRGCPFIRHCRISDQHTAGNGPAADSQPFPERLACVYDRSCVSAVQHAGPFGYSHVLNVRCRKTCIQHIFSRDHKKGRRIKEKAVLFRILLMFFIERTEHPRIERSFLLQDIQDSRQLFPEKFFKFGKLFLDQCKPAALFILGRGCIPSSA